MIKELKQMQKLKIFSYGLKPRNIVEAYVLAARASEMNPTAKMQAFRKVIDFCEQDVVCAKEDSIKRNTLLFWSYDKVAQAEMHHKRYGEALSLWLKSCSLSVSPYALIRQGNKMLSLIDSGKLNILEKAKNLCQIAVCLQKAYLETGQSEEAEKMKRLQEISASILQRSEN